MADPLTTLSAPADPGGSCTTYSRSSGSATINPGKYCSITLSGSANVTLAAGVYYITGDVRVYGTARMTANNVLLYLTDDNISIEDNAIVTLSAPTTGTYKGLAIFMETGDSLNVQDDAQVTINGGTVYAPEAFLTVYGLTSGHRAYLIANGSQFIVDSAWVGASSSCTSYTSCTNTRGDLYITYDEDQVYGAAGGAASIELSE
jgi:hypothetical protein